jgi:hypothetical protein
MSKRIPGLPALERRRGDTHDAAVTPLSSEKNSMRQDHVQLRRFGLCASAVAAGLFLSACGGGSAGDPPHQPTAQTISFAAPANQTMGTAPPALSASASSSLAVSFTSTTAAVCGVSGTTLTLVAPGTCSITAAQAGNNIYAAATAVSQSFTVAAAPIAQTITFASPGNQTLGTAPPALSATASSGLAVSYASSTPAVCTASGTSTTLTLVAAGTCTIVASQSGDSTHAAAPSISDSFTVAGGPAAQTITFATPGNQTLGTAPAALAATASSGLPVSYVSTTTSVCTVSGATLSLLSAGTCSITASQAGDSTHAAAASVTDAFTVSSASIPVLTFSSGFATGTTVEAGAFGGYSGSDIDGWNCGAPASCGSGGSFTPSVTADNSGFYYYYQTPTPALVGEYVGVYLQAPGLTTGLSGSADTPGLQLAGQTTMKITFRMNPEWFSSTTHNVGVILTLGKLYNTPGACNIQLLSVFTPTAQAATAYAIPLSSFTFKQDCAAGLTVAAALAAAPVSQVDFQGDGGSAALTAGGASTGANMSVPTTGGSVVYPTTLVVNGAVTFQ